MAVTINGTSGVTFNNGSTQAISGGMGTSATAQTWQNVTGSRAFGTTYTNSTGYPIEVFILSGGAGGTATLQVNINGVNYMQAYASPYAVATLTFIVPNGATYSATGGVGGQWTELR
jgi:hypothetical protein